MKIPFEKKYFRTSKGMERPLIESIKCQPALRALEVCIDNFDAAVKAIKGGAARLEICSSLSEGGLTPSFGLVKLIKDKLPHVSIYIMIRCKSGSDFCYKDTDVDVMLEDIKIFKTIDVGGFVFGALKTDGSIDEETCKRVISASRPLRVTFHRAFDVCINPKAAIETIIDLGFERILTSGCQPKAISDEACKFISDILQIANKRILIMPGSGLDPVNVKKVLDLGVTEVHASCLVKGKTNVDLKKIDMGKNLVDCSYEIDQDRVESFVSILETYANFS